MKTKHLHRALWLLLPLLTVLTQPAWADTAATMAAGTNGSAAKVNDKDAIKVGTNSKGGTMTITVGAGATKLTLYAAAWKNVTGLSLNITPNENVEPTSISLTADAGINGSSPFTLNGTESNYKFEITLKNITEETTLTFTSSSAKRFVVWGAEYQTGGSSPLHAHSSIWKCYLVNHFNKSNIALLILSCQAGARYYIIFILHCTII